MRVLLALVSMCVGVSVVRARSPAQPTAPDRRLADKWIMMFKYFDLSNTRDNVLSKADFTWMEGHLKESKPFGNIAEEVADLTYDFIAKKAIADLGRDVSGSLSKYELIAFLQRKMRQGTLVDFVSEYNSKMHGLLRLSNTGELTRTNFVQFQKDLGQMDATTAGRAFDAIAGVGQSSVSEMQYVDVYKWYMADPTASAARFPLYAMMKPIVVAAQSGVNRDMRLSLNFNQAAQSQEERHSHN